MNKKESSMLLFEEIGQIDEDILHECSDYYPVRRKNRRSLRAVIIAAAALTTLISVVLVGTFAVMLRRGLSGNMSQNDDYGEGKHIETPAEEPAMFAENWAKLTEEETHERIFGSTPAVLCKKRGEDTYRYAALTDVQYDGIVSDAPKDSLPDGQNEWQIWVTDGKGMVFTPYLQASPGNIHYGRLFDYNDEVEPGGYFQNVLRLIGT